MRLLLYGGCHALIMKRLIDELGNGLGHLVDLLVNFEVIASGSPFPYERLRNYDAVIYSPVRNKGKYNTNYLEEACANLGVQTICFPWLEWHGHAPGADKDWFWGQHTWFFPELIERSRDFWDFDAFARNVIHEFPRSDNIDRIVSTSTQKIIDQETEFSCGIRVSDFILENFRSRRMFNTPDHPSSALYQCVVERLERVLEARLIGSWPTELPECQPEERIPILPRVAEQTSLAYSDVSWRSGSQPLAVMGLEGFLSLHFHAGRRAARTQEERDSTVFATAARSTWMVSHRNGYQENNITTVPMFTQMLLRYDGNEERCSHFKAEVIDVLAGHLFLEEESKTLEGSYLFRCDDWVIKQ